MTAWVNNKRPVGRPITTNKTSIAKSTKLPYPPNILYYDIICTQIAKPDISMDSFGSLNYWINDAMDEKKMDMADPGQT